MIYDLVLGLDQLAYRNADLKCEGQQKKGFLNKDEG